MQQISETGFLRISQIVGDKKRGLAPIVPISRSTWWAWVKSGKAPKPIKLSSGVTVWKIEDIRSLICAETAS